MPRTDLSLAVHMQSTLGRATKHFNVIREQEGDLFAAQHMLKEMTRLCGRVLQYGIPEVNGKPMDVAGALSWIESRLAELAELAEGQPA